MSTNVPIASVTLSASAPSIIFTNIPQTYTDLVLVFSGANTVNNNNYLSYRFNGDSGSNYSLTLIRGDGSNYGSARFQNETQMFNSYGSPLNNTQQNSILQIMNYSNTTTYKTMLFRTNALGAVPEVNAIVGLWRSTAAITSIVITISNNNIAAGSTFNLYGINAANSAQAKATGGDTIIRDASYWYHVFNRSGTFTPSQSLTADVLVVAGGGGSGASTSGNYTSSGGGAGGYLKHTSQSLTATNYTVTVGAGGTGVTVGTNNGNKGSNSQFASLTLSEGGGFGGANTGGANSGGSGGGGSVSANGGAATAGQGFAGGNGGPGASNYTGGGGGGAGGAGSNGTSTNGGAGGAGTNADSSFLTITGSGVSGYIAGGGGGASWGAGLAGAGGSGGGGLGGGNSTQGAGTAGAVNTGSGAGGGGNGYNGANGGSGIVIVRYPV